MWLLLRMGYKYGIKFKRRETRENTLSNLPVAGPSRNIPNIEQQSGKKYENRSEINDTFKFYR
jgi:hypothetical protein